MPIYLNSFEKSFDDPTQQLGQEIIEKELDQITHNESEKNLWLFRHFNDPVEVEILLAGRKVSSFTCDCEAFQFKKQCGHIFASLFKLKNYKNSLKKPKPVQARNLLPKRLNINTVLQYANERELKEYIRFWGRKDKRFALYLRTKFANKIPIEDNDEKYLILVSQTIKDALDQKGQLKVKGSALLSDICEELFEQANDSVSLRQYKEALYILHAILVKCVRLRFRLETVPDKLDEIIIKAEKSLCKLILNELPNDLIEELKSKLQLVVSERTYEALDISYNTFQILISVCRDKQEFEELLQYLSETYLTKRFEKNTKAVLSVCVKNLLDRSHDEGLAHLLIKYPEHLSQFLTITQNLMDAKNYTEAQKLVNLIKKHVPKVEKNIHFLTLNFSLARHLSFDERALGYASQLFVLSKDFKYYDFIKSQEKASFYLENIEHTLKNHQHNSVNMLVYGRFLVFETKWDDLYALLKQSDDLDFIFKLDHYLYQANPVLLLQFYKDHLARYLSAHFGLQSKLYVQKIIYHLRRISAREIHMKLEDWIAYNYKERKVLS